MSRHIVTTLDEALALPGGTKVRDRFGDRGVVHDGTITFYETAPLSIAYVIKHFGPLTVIEPTTFERKHGRPKPPRLSVYTAALAYARGRGTTVIRKSRMWPEWQVAGPHVQHVVVAPTREGAIALYKRRAGIL